ncbi:hypothetical protein KC19_10G125300 [Ceratodon purpureus]|uniref:Uncharacterized protein n=1 Tax=Ceratodon purpureus TaxID=3225 RepID=A0A8T0GL60_CERPU|nr:hypothetical protein KC19_10G125300 [Ceratodon purpureus]
MPLCDTNSPFSLSLHTYQYHIHLIQENSTVAGAESSNRFHAHQPHPPNFHSLFIDSSVIYFHGLLKVVANLVCLMSPFGSSITMLQTQIVLPSTIRVLPLKFACDNFIVL